MPALTANLRTAATLPHITVAANSYDVTISSGGTFEDHIEFDTLAASHGSVASWSVSSPKDLVVNEAGIYHVSFTLMLKAQADPSTTGPKGGFGYVDFYEAGTDPDVAGIYGGSSSFHHPAQWSHWPVFPYPQTQPPGSVASSVTIPLSSSVMYLPSGMTIRQSVYTDYDDVVEIYATAHLAKLG